MGTFLAHIIVRQKRLRQILALNKNSTIIFPNTPILNVVYFQATLAGIWPILKQKPRKILRSELQYLGKMIALFLTSFSTYNEYPFQRCMT